MKNKKVHMQALSTTWCGLNMYPADVISAPTIAKAWKEVTCKNCMRTPLYKTYLAGKFKEKP